MRIIVRRFVELILPLMVLSAVTTFLYTRSLVPATRDVLAIIMCFMCVLYLLFNGYMLKCCFVVSYQPMDYYLYNGAAYLLFALTNAAFYHFFDNNTYTWLFSLTKTLSAVYEKVSTLYSIVIFNGIVILTIIVAPWIGEN